MKQINRKIKFYYGLYGRRSINKKNFFLLLLLFCLVYIYLDPVKNFSFQAGIKEVAPFTYPFLITDTNFLVLFMAGVIYYYSDIPNMNKWNSYYIIRTGRKRWLKGELAYVIMSALEITFLSIAMTVLALFPYVNWENGWGKVLYTLAKTNAGEQCGLFWHISLQYMTQNSPIKAMMFAGLISVLGISFTGMLILTVSFYFTKTMGIVTATIMTVMVSIIANLGDFAKQGFTKISPVSWMQVTNMGVTRYGYTIAPTLGYAIVGFVVLILFCIGMSVYKINRMDFLWESVEV